MLTAKLIGSIVSVLVGGALATVSVVGVVNHTVNSPSSNPGSVDAGVPYGSTQ